MPSNAGNVFPSAAASDANGNLTAKTDARGITTKYTYDDVNRLTGKTYWNGTTQDPTPPAKMNYDESSVSIGSGPNAGTFAIANGIGFLTSQCAGQSSPGVGVAVKSFSYDPMGRMNQINECWDTTQCGIATGTRGTTWAYDLAGNLSVLTNSAALTLNYTYDGAGRLATASNTARLTINGSPTTVVTPMVSAMTYFPSGQPHTMTTNTATDTLTGTWGIDNRLRVNSYVNLSTAGSGATNYGYTLGYTPNNNISTATETVYQPTVGAKTWTWAYHYDSLNRLANGTTVGFIRYGCQETYDQWGNRTAQAPYGGTGYSCTSFSATPLVDNNRFSGYSYDAAGNLLFDGTNTLTYDAEGRLSSSTSSASGTTTYAYGADGQRIGKTVGGVTTNYVRHLDGSPLASYSGGSYANNPEELWVAGKHFGTVIVTPGGHSQTQSFSLTSWLGTEAVRTDPTSGLPTSAFLSQPFGDYQTTIFGSDTNSIHFTGKERDTESALDYFGGRYYGSSMGRWISPDLLNLTDERLLNPSNTLNKYAYAANNPLKYIDPDGKDITFFYDQAGIAGHAVLFAYNPANKDWAIESFGPNIHAPVGLGVSDFDMDQFGSEQKVRNLYAAITIQTNPELTQEIITYIRNNPDPSVWAVTGPNCSTQCGKILQKFKLDYQHSLVRRNLSPKFLFKNLMKRYNPSLQNVSPVGGVDYGTPSYDMFDLLWLAIKSGQNATVKVNVANCVTDLNGQKHCDTTQVY